MGEYSIQGMKKEPKKSVLFCVLTSEITDVLGFVGIKGQVANGCYERINAKGKIGKEKIRKSS